jgi:hypothetical protein
VLEEEVDLHIVAIIPVQQQVVEQPGKQAEEETQIMAQQIMAVEVEELDLTMEVMEGQE